jgi:hypothetical protein
MEVVGLGLRSIKDVDRIATPGNWEGGCKVSSRKERGRK